MGGVSADASTHPDGPLERFPCSSRVLGLVSLGGMAVAVVLVLTSGLSLVQTAVLAGVALFALGVWLTMVRPAVHLYRDHLLVRNALTDISVPWHLVESVEVRQVLVIRTEERMVHGLAVGRSARKQLRAGLHDRAAGSASGDSRPMSTDPAGIGPAPVLGGKDVRYIDYADVVVHRIDNMADAHRRESERLTSVERRWRRAEAIAVAVVGVAFVGLVVAAVVV
jgi:hypothetical protein